MQPKDLSRRIKQLIDQSHGVLSTLYRVEMLGNCVDAGKMSGLRASVLSFITMVYGKNHSHYEEFDSATNDSYESNAKRGHEILLSIQNEIDGGWIFSVKQLVSAEIFSDFLEMADHLLKQGYKDSAAVMIGSVLEENLRQLCINNGIDADIEKDGSFIPKKADRIKSQVCCKFIFHQVRISHLILRTFALAF